MSNKLHGQARRMSEPEAWTRLGMSVFGVGMNLAPIFTSPVGIEAGICHPGAAILILGSLVPVIIMQPAAALERLFGRGASAIRKSWP